MRIHRTLAGLELRETGRFGFIMYYSLDTDLLLGSEHENS